MHLSLSLLTALTLAIGISGCSMRPILAQPRLDTLALYTTVIQGVQDEYPGRSWALSTRVVPECGWHCQNPEGEDRHSPELAQALLQLGLVADVCTPHPRATGCVAAPEQSSIGLGFPLARPDGTVTVHVILGLGGEHVDVRALEYTLRHLHERWQVTGVRLRSIT